MHDARRWSHWSLLHNPCTIILHLDAIPRRLQMYCGMINEALDKHKSVAYSLIPEKLEETRKDLPRNASDVLSIFNMNSCQRLKKRQGR